MNKILVIDFEATCWENYDPPEGQEQEIIEIGLATVRYDIETGDYYFARYPDGSIFVQPQRSEVSEFCTELTGISPEIASGGYTFDDAMDFLRENQRVPWASWGEWDRRQLERECKAKGVKYPLNYHHINVKSMWATLRGQSMTGLKTAVEDSGHKFLGRHHSGADDALNVAMLLRDLIERYNRGANRE